MNELLNTAPGGFLSFASDGQILMANQTLAGWLASTPDQLQGHSIKSLLSLGGRVFYETHFWPQLELKGQIEEVYFSLRAKDGTSVPVLANAARAQRDGQVVYNCVILRMRQRDQYENEIILAKRAAEQANQSKANFLSMMSHELRTPLNAIVGFTQLIASGVHGPVTQHQIADLKHIQVGSDALLHLINDILNFAHMEREGVEVHKERVDVEEAILRAESLMKPRLEEAGQHYKSERASQSVAVVADSSRLQQILLNLLSNAIKFTPRGGCIYVTHAISEDKVCIEVRDSGIGIPKDQLQRIFEPFVQVNRLEVESSQRGVGLGLAICRELARAMEGELSVSSTLGEGSAFTVCLPKYDPESYPDLV